LTFEVFKTHPDPIVRMRRIQGTLLGLGRYENMPKLQDRYKREVLDRLLAASLPL